MPALAYLFALIPGGLALFGLWTGGPWLLAAPLFVFGLVPLLELFLKGSDRNADAAAEVARRADPLHALVVYAVVPLHLAVLGTLLWRASTGELAGPWLVAACATAGLSCGAYGLNVGHELGHRQARLPRLLAKVLMTSSSYAWFFVEHNRGHHARVATPEDPATARRGEVLYAFWLRSITGGLRSAWGLEAGRLARGGRGPWTWDNEVLRLLVGQTAVTAAIFAGLGPVAGGAFLAAGLVGVLLLETVNYVEHYGLVRARRPDGRYERVRPAHSWNSNHPLGRLLLFDLTRHADHHAHPARPYAVLRHFDDAPRLPTGYPGMVLLALVPPLFHRVMDEHVVRERERVDLAA